MKIDRYEVVRELGRGAMGVVYLARHHTTGREVALKVLHEGSGGSGGSATKAALERFQREARAMGAVASSENVVSVLDAGMDSATGSPFLVMELLSGEDMEGCVRGSGRFRSTSRCGWWRRRSPGSHQPTRLASFTGISSHRTCS